MSVRRLPSGRWRAQAWDPITRRNVSAAKLIGDRRASYATKREARAAEDRARAILGRDRSNVTVKQFADRWLHDPLFARSKESTMLHNAERIAAFVDRYGHLQLEQVTDRVVGEWLAGGQRNGTVPALRAMFADATKAKAGRLLPANPFAGLGLKKTKGNKDRQPPTEEQMRELVDKAWELTPPSFAAYLETGCYTALRPGELDALEWDRIRWADGEIDVVVQWSVKVRKFTPPKYGPYTVALVDRARDTLDRLRTVGLDHPESPYVFTTIRGNHYTPSARNHHWNRVRAGVGLGDMSLYLATRHYFGWFALNVLELPASIVAEQLGHRDGGKLVEQLYGHPDRRRRRSAIRDAFANRPRHLRALDGGAA